MRSHWKTGESCGDTGRLGSHRETQGDWGVVGRHRETGETQGD